MEACSDSQEFSVLDASTDYCNVHDLVCGTDLGCKVVKHDFKIAENQNDISKSCTQHDGGQCLKATDGSWVNKTVV